MVNAIDSVGTATRAVRTQAAGSAPRVAGGNGKDLPAQGTGGAAQPAAQSDQLEQAVSKLNHFVQNIRRDLHFSVDDSTGRTVIQVVDSESEEVIRQIPPEEALVLAHQLEHVTEGAILREKA